MSISEDEQTTHERAIRQMMDDWARALERRDAAAMTAHYAPDVAVFDVKPPYVLQGVDAYRSTWGACFPYLPRRFRCERKDIALTVGTDLAFCHCLSRIAPVDEPDHPAR